MPRRADPPRVFLLSPAHSGGKRAALLLREEASFPLAVRLREPDGVPLGEAFSFLSGLYFRGKLTYASRFARPPAGVEGVQVITANRGLAAAETRVRPAELRAFGSVDIQSDDPQYRDPLVRDVARLAEHPTLELILLGSVATGKYVDVLLDVVGERLLFPTDFVGRGDMSRGALLLRSAREGRELSYEPVAGALRRLRPRSRGAANDGDQGRHARDPDPDGPK
ncbi:MAG TPA: hypothetical protein VHG35_06520 [Gemmatimonadales bacterium]|nr:hypothetical protein [Gemmatimonadales bacterium]